MASRSKLYIALLLALALTLGSVAARALSQAPADSSRYADPSTTATSTAAPSAAPQTPPANSSGMVWVNTDSGVYHKPGTRYYGKTKHGKYMLEADAIKAGYHAAGKS